MTEVLQSPSPSHFPSPSSSSTPNDGSHPHALINGQTIEGHLGTEEEQEEVGGGDRKRKERDREGDQLSLLALLVAAFRKSLIGCSTPGSGKLSSMEIGWPSNVRHVAHVTFDRFHGFLGLPVEFEPEVPRRAPSARSVSKFRILFLFLDFRVIFWLMGHRGFVCFENLYMLQVMFCVLDLLVSWILS